MEEFFDKVIEFLKSPKTWISAGIVILGIVIWITLVTVENHFIKKHKGNKHASQLKALNNIVKCALIIIVVLAVLEVNGVNVSSMITGLGVVTVIVGFALQDFLKDFVMGINIIWDGYFKIGDVIRYEDEYWEVIDMSIKVTKLRNIDSNTIFTVGNRNISQIEVVSNYQDFVVPGPYEVPTEEMKKVCEKICDRLTENEIIEKALYIGTDSLDASQISYKIRVYGKPVERDEIKRYSFGMIMDVLTENGIDVPFNQLDVHMDQKK